MNLAINTFLKYTNGYITLFANTNMLLNKYFQQ